MTRARAKALYEKVNSLLSTCDFGSTLDSMLPHSDTLCILRYEPSSGQGAAVKIGQDWSYKREEEKEMVASDQFGDQTGAAGPPADPTGTAGPITGSSRTTTQRASSAAAEPSGRHSGAAAHTPNEPAPSPAPPNLPPLRMLI